MFLHALQDVLLWFPVSQLWEGAGALETAGIFTHPKRQNWIDGSLKSPQERRRKERRGGGAGRGVHSLIPIGSRHSDPAPPLSFLLRWLFTPEDFPILLLYLKHFRVKFTRFHSLCIPCGTFALKVFPY